MYKKLSVIRQKGRGVMEIIENHSAFKEFPFFNLCISIWARQSHKYASHT